MGYPFFVFVLCYDKAPVIIEKRCQPVDDLRVREIYFIKKHPVTFFHGPDKVPVVPFEVALRAFLRQVLSYELGSIGLGVQIYSHEVVPGNVSRVSYE